MSPSRTSSAALPALLLALLPALSHAGQTTAPRVDTIAALEASFIYPNDIGVSPDGRYLYVNDVTVPSDDGQTLAPTRLRRIELATERP